MSPSAPAAKPRRSCLPWVAALLLAHAPCQATPPLRFAVMDAPPFGFSTAAGTPAGLYPAILAALSAEARVPIEVQVVPFARAAHEVAGGAADGTLMFSHAVTRNRVVALAPVFLTAQTVQVGPGVAIHSRADLRPLLIGRLRGGCQELEAEAGPPWRFHELNSHQQGVEMLAAHRIDALCSTPEALDEAATRSGRQQLLDPAARWPLAQREVWLMVSSKVDPALHQPLRDGLQRLQHSGALARLFRDALGPRYHLVLPPAPAGPRPAAPRAECGAGAARRWDCG